ncbi:MAG: DUF58 domain-containing protein [Planctomycetota bacterium]|nr:DUF58 domain-containing protein [Planctomycetota bacterium]
MAADEPAVGRPGYFGGPWVKEIAAVRKAGRTAARRMEIMAAYAPFKFLPKMLAARALRLLAIPAAATRGMTGIGWAVFAAALVSGALGIRLGNVPFLLSAILFSMLLVGASFGRLCVRGVSLRRSLPDRVFAGDRIGIALTIENSSVFPAGALRIEERLAGEAARRGYAFAAGIPAGGSEKVRYEMRPRRRGVHGFRPTLVSTTFPFGVFSTVARLEPPGQLAVSSRMGEVERGVYLEMERTFVRMARTRPSREDDDFRGLREYRPGDNPRWIHWRTSARLGKPLVREFERTETRRVAICLDTCTRRLGPRGEALLEQAISFAATLARDCVRMGCEVNVAAFAPGLMQIRLSMERRNLDVLLECLAGLKPAPDKDLEQLYDAMDREILPRAYVVIIGLGSLRMGLDLSRYRTPDNCVRTIEAGSPDFAAIFRRGAREAGEEIFAGEEEGLEEADVELEQRPVV